MKAIEMQRLTKIYHKTPAIDAIDLVVEEGEFYGFIGPNGAGKSTAIKCLLNFISPNAGSATIFGQDCQKQNKEIKKSVGYISSDVRFYPKMTTDEIITYTAEMHGVTDIEQKKKYYYEMFEVDQKKKLGEMSLGNKKKVALIAGLLPEPKLLILDEPTNGLDPLMQHRLFDELNRRNKEGMTIFLSSHDLNEVQNYCTKAAFIKEGKIITVENIEKDKADGKVIQLVGNNLPLAELEKIGVIVLKQELNKVRLLHHGNIQIILPLLQTPEIQDITITNQQLEDKFMTLYENETKKRVI